MNILQPREARLLINFFCLRIHGHSIVPAFAKFLKESMGKVLWLTRNAHHCEPLLAEEVLDHLHRTHRNLHANSTSSASPAPPRRSTATQPSHPQTPRRIFHPLLWARTFPTRPPRYTGCPTIRPNAPAPDKSETRSDSA